METDEFLENREVAKEGDIFLDFLDSESDKRFFRNYVLKRNRGGKPTYDELLSKLDENVIDTKKLIEQRMKKNEKVEIRIKVVTAYEKYKIELVKELEKRGAEREFINSEVNDVVINNGLRNKISVSDMASAILI